MLKTTININHSHNHCSMDSCGSLLLLPVATQKQILKYTTVANTKCTSLPSANRIIYASWLRYHIKLLDSQLPSKALIYFNATNISMVKDSI